MKRTIGFRNDLELAIRTEESGRAVCRIDLSSLTRMERLFLFGLIQKAKEVGFGVHPMDSGQSRMEIVLGEPSAIDQAVSQAVTH